MLWSLALLGTLDTEVWDALRLRLVELGVTVEDEALAKVFHVRGTAVPQQLRAAQGSSGQLSSGQPPQQLRAVRLAAVPFACCVHTSSMRSGPRAHGL